MNQANTANEKTYDAIVIGGGPGGATAAIVLARAGLSVAVFEKASFPRFHIGESLVPRITPLLRELGLLGKFDRVPHVPKFGVEFGMGDESDPTRLTFDRGLFPGEPTLNVERAGFDKMLLDEARAAGAEVFEGTGVKRILKLSEGDVGVETDHGPARARYLLDASGQGTVVARHLGTRKAHTDPHLQKVAYFEHFDNVFRRPVKEECHPSIFMCEEGWFWLIPIDRTRTSIGFVTSPGTVKDAGVPANRMLAWAMRRCPAVHARLVNASGPDTNQVAADFSYTCRPYAGPGYFLIGDAAAFLDPIFSTGVTLSMVTAKEAAGHVIAVLRRGADAAAAREDYAKFVRTGTRVFFKIIRQYYRHSFRELFLNGTGPIQIHRALLSILAGHVFPRPRFALWWRLQLFHLIVALNAWVPLVPRRKRFSLLVQPPAEGPAAGAARAVS